MIGFAAFVVNSIIVIMRPQIDFNSQPHSSLVVRLAPDQNLVLTIFGAFILVPFISNTPHPRCNCSSLVDYTDLMAQNLG